MGVHNFGTGAAICTAVVVVWWSNRW
jgi:hypothetical protein